jgi:hypothetical protein
VKNIGRRPAVIEELLIDASTKAMPPEPDYKNLPWWNFFFPVIEFGETHTFSTVDMATCLAIPERDHTEVITGRKEICVWGRVLYGDTLGQRYEIGFGWILKPPRNDKAIVIAPSNMALGQTAYNYHRKWDLPPPERQRTRWVWPHKGKQAKT